ncbi:MAG: signal recognition particle-docking protein FtsY [Bacillales bacterium]|jgi:fused signal recognition particle receptor|nr:signal recognition particle-docking protein FtsY [Bacillales bacterium]
MSIFSKIKEKLFGKSKVVQEKYLAGLDKANASFKSKLKVLSSKYNQINADYYDELEEILIQADIGVHEVLGILDSVKNEVSKERITDPKLINDIVVDKIYIAYVEDGYLDTIIHFPKDELKIILLVGVNGSGKTTTIAKLANMFKDKKKVLLAAADTFRAGATEQLEIWANRLKIPLVKKEKGDPASVVYDALKKANEEKFDLLLVDTAGRLENKSFLMDELAKIKRIVSKSNKVENVEVLLIVDATTGQNGVFQAKGFAQATGVDGIILTKMDGTSKGGIILAIKSQLQIPVKFIGLGEKLDDLQEFDLDLYLNGLFGG